MRTGLAVIALSLLAACGGGSDRASDEQSSNPASAAASARVTVELQFPFITTPRTATATEECEGALDYLGVRDGSAVTIRDADNSVVGQAALRLVETERSSRCVWEAQVSDMTTSSKFFTAEIPGWKSSVEEREGRNVDFDLSATDKSGELDIDNRWTATS